MVSKFRREDHALFGIRAHAILPQVPRSVGHKIPLQSFTGPDAGADPRDHNADLHRNGGPYSEGRVGARPRPHVPVDPAKAIAVGCHATDQGSVVTPHPDGVSGTAQALLGQTVLGPWLLFDHIWKCDR